MSKQKNKRILEAAHPPRSVQAEDEDNIIKLYLNEIGRYKLLTPLEEVALAARVKKGDGRARMLLIKTNLRLVVKIAKKFKGHGLPLLDLIQEGNIGLMKAAARFDPRKGAKMSTYASWWIEQTIGLAISYQSRTIRVPVRVADVAIRIYRIADEMYAWLEREPTDREIGEELGISAKKVGIIRRMMRDPVSLDDSLDGRYHDSSTYELIEDDLAVPPDEAADARIAARKLGRLLRLIGQKERTILEMRFGINGCQREHTFVEIGRKLRLSRERPRQITRDAMRRLKVLAKLDTLRMQTFGVDW